MPAVASEKKIYATPMQGSQRPVPFKKNQSIRSSRLVSYSYHIQINICERTELLYRLLFFLYWFLKYSKILNCSNILNFLLQHKSAILFSICLSIFCLLQHLSICLSVYLSICLSVYLSICLSVYLSICLPVYMSIWNNFDNLRAPCKKWTS